MLRSQIFLPTLKETPESAEIPSHIYSLRGGFIRQVSSGIYTYLPLGVRVLEKIIRIIREELNSIGAQELILPFILPRELWDSTGRWEEFGPEMMKFKDRKEREFSLAPTHEEAITDLVKREIRSYRDLPLILYQIQPKFRDEPRPRFGLLRSRQFIMKDAYSFHRNEKDLEEAYNKIKDAYLRIFKRCGLNVVIVEADPGLMGGKVSHEFMAPAENGEDIIVLCKNCGYASNREMARTISLAPLEEEEKPIKKVPTPGASSIEDVSQLLNLPPKRLVKTLILESEKGPVALMVRGDHELNLLKVKKLLGVKNLELASPALIEKVTQAPVGFAGPVGLKGVKIIADYRVAELKNFVTGANEKDAHYINVNSGRDFTIDVVGDVRYITDEDPCPNCKQKIELKKAIEVGHIFKLGTRYSEDMKAYFQDEDGKTKPFIMGCYGIGVDRIWLTAIEQNHDESGIIWPWNIAPFQIIILPINIKEEKIKEMAFQLHHQLEEKGYEVLLDDRDERAGVKFKDADLTGIPLQLVIGNKYLQEGKLEAKIRGKEERWTVSPGEVENFLEKLKKTLE
ncbi:MAG TPA: proline--tRNA ligase [bacterium]|nr:proline--tRNA ligase [bacterium]HEX67577.1 proline--tRNA ligase [bacterium]